MIRDQARILYLLFLWFTHFPITQEVYIWNRQHNLIFRNFSYSSKRDSIASTSAMVLSTGIWPNSTEEVG